MKKLFSLYISPTPEKKKNLYRKQITLPVATPHNIMGCLGTRGPAKSYGKGIPYFKLYSPVLSYLNHNDIKSNES